MVNLKINNNKIASFFSLFLLFLILGLVTIPSNAISSYSPEIKEGQSHTWKIQYITNKTIAWWDSRGFQGNFRANEGDIVIFEINTIADDIEGKFIFGNMTLTLVNDSDIASALTLSIWPWFPGLISHLNWSQVIVEAKAANTGFMQGNLTIVEYTRFILFSYQQNKTSGQNTTLIYDLNTGILMSGYTAFGDYYLGLVYEEKLENESVIGVESTIWIIIAAGIIAMIAYMKKSNKLVVKMYDI